MPDPLDLDTMPCGTLAEFTQPDGRRTLAVVRAGRLIPLWAAHALPTVLTPHGTAGRPGTAIDATTGRPEPSNGQRTVWGVVPDSSDPAPASADLRSGADGTDGRRHDSGGAMGGTPQTGGRGVGRGAPTRADYFQVPSGVPSGSVDDSIVAGPKKIPGGFRLESSYAGIDCGVPVCVGSDGRIYPYASDRSGGFLGVVTGFSLGRVGAGDHGWSEKISGGDFPGIGLSAAVDGSKAADSPWVPVRYVTGMALRAGRFYFVAEDDGKVYRAGIGREAAGMTAEALAAGQACWSDACGRLWATPGAARDGGNG